jgi:molecular chaperone GrpE
MNSSKNSQNRQESSNEFKFDDSTSLDDFLKEIEARERDLHISSEMVIEIDDSDSGEDNLPEFLSKEFLGPTEVTAQNAPQKSGGNFPASPTAISLLENEIVNLQSKVSSREGERDELLKMLQRRQTDFENFKKRVERERGDTYLNQLSNLANQMLPVLDNLNRALDSASNYSDGKMQDFQHFFDGIVLVNQQLNEVLAEMGITPIKAVGEYFDPHFHEAASVEETDEYPPNMVTAEFLRGYRIGDKVVRASMVRVSSPTKSAPPSVSDNKAE